MTGSRSHRDSGAGSGQTRSARDKVSGPQEGEDEAMGRRSRRDVAPARENGGYWRRSSRDLDAPRGTPTYYGSRHEGRDSGVDSRRRYRDRTADDRGRGYPEGPRSSVYAGGRSPSPGRFAHAFRPSDSREDRRGEGRRYPSHDDQRAAHHSRWHRSSRSPGRGRPMDRSPRRHCEGESRGQGGGALRGPGYSVASYEGRTGPRVSPPGGSRRYPPPRDAPAAGTRGSPDYGRGSSMDRRRLPSRSPLTGRVRTRAPAPEARGRRRSRSSTSSSSSRSSSSGSSSDGSQDSAEKEDLTEEQLMAKLIGITQFDTSQNKDHTASDVSGINRKTKRRYRQYMNRRGGFNRPLSPVF